MNPLQLVIFLQSFEIIFSNILLNGGFEDATLSPWTVTERTSMWKVDAVNINTDGIQTDQHSNSGRQSALLKLHSKHGFDKKYHARWLSQYVLFQKPNSEMDNSLQLFFWYECNQNQVPLCVQLDVSYANDERLNVRHEVTCKGTFTRSCINLPVYGKIRAVMLHIIIEKHTDSEVYIDDVNVVLNQNIPQDCPVYLGSFPKRRQAMLHFLKPQIKHNSKITLCTQMTIDRLPYIIQTAKLWKGPISASLLLFENTKTQSAQIKELLSKFYSEAALYEHVTIHVIFADRLNNEDDTKYPVNFLRNIAISNSETQYVFYLDADISPVYSEEQAYEWLVTARAQLNNHSDTAYIAPVFQTKCSDCPLPTSKSNLLELVETTDEKSKLHPFQVVSHSVVNYRKWYIATEAYPVAYRRDMEPYFIVERATSPLMYGAYAGYGRDKCAYSTDLHHSGFRFAVLPSAFLINQPELAGSMTILQRSRGLALDVFLTIAFHDADLANGWRTPHQLYRQHGNMQNAHSSTPDIADEGSCSTVGCEEVVSNRWRPDVSSTESDDVERSVHNDAGTRTEALSDGAKTHQGPVVTGIETESESQKDSTVAQVKLETKQDPIEASGVTCRQTVTQEALQAGKERLLRRTNIDLLHVFIEDLMRTYGTYGYAEMVTEDKLRSNAAPSVTLHYLFLMHVRPVVMFACGASEASETTVRGVTRYALTSKPEACLSDLLKMHPEPLVLLFSEGPICTNVYLGALSDNHIVVQQGMARKLNVTELHEKMCHEKPEWELFMHDGEVNDLVTLKSITLNGHRALNVIEAPLMTTLTEAPKCSEDFSTDVFLFTKNRPMQTFAFLESLSQLASGITTVWVLYKADGNNVFQEAYLAAESCSKQFAFKTRFISQGGTLGRSLLSLIEESPAHCSIIAVDELIWLRPLSLEKLCCYLYHFPDIATAQLRLGENLSSFPISKKNNLFQNRINEVPFQSDLLTLYPAYMPFDFGYILHVDGLMTKRKRLLEDFRDVLLAGDTPSRIEGGMINAQLSSYARAYHLMYRSSRVVNNMELKDGRVAMATEPSARGIELAEAFVRHGETLDVRRFAEQHGNHGHTHEKLAVSFVKNQCLVR